jgi:uncharacterized membrane protein
MIWNSYEPNVKATIAFLKLLKVKVTNATVDDTLQSHPDWPSLLCISDSLNKWHIPNAAARIDKNDIENLPLPFIAYVHDREYPLAIVTGISDGTVEYCTKDYNQKKRKKTKEDFLKSWDGVYLMAEPTKESGEKDYAGKKKSQVLKKLIPATLITSIIFLFSYTLYRSAVIAQVNEWAVYTQLMILIAGVFITTLLLWYEMDKNNPVLQKVCTGITKGNCNAILTGKQAKVFSWLSWSEVGFFYFTGSLLNFVFAGSLLPEAIILLSWLSLLALPYTIYSIYYQWQVAKQWCVLCLAVQLLLVLGVTHTLVFYHFKGLGSVPLTYYPLFIFLLFYRH